MILFFITACTKIDSTRLGSDLIPVVDNVNTFETILPVVANNYVDDQDYRLNAANPHVVGALTQDPAFGNARATMFFEMKPASYPYTFANPDSLTGTGTGFDSAVLILDYLGYYGDSSVPVNLNLYEVSSPINADTSLVPYYTLQPALAADHSKLWGSKTVQANGFKDSIAIIRADTTKVVNQLRIRLDNNLAKQLFEFDTLSVYKSDSAFEAYLPGFALESDATAKTLLYFTLGSASKIEFYFRAKGTGGIDTTSTSFSLTAKSGHAVKFDNDRSGAEINTFLTPDTINGNDKIFIQTSPGASAKLTIKGLDTFKTMNRIIHRAELRITQVEPLADPQLLPPNALYLDLIDTASEITYKGVPYDLSPSPGANYYCYPNSNGISFGYFGGLTHNENVANNSVPVYRFNISRYLQSVVSRGEPLYQFRLSAPFYMFYKNCANSSTSYPQQVFPFTDASTGSLLNPPGKGRIKVAGGGSNVPQNIRMQLRIIYSKL